MHIQVERVRAVCFDLGGVMVRIAGSWLEAIDRAGVEAGCRPSSSLRLTDVPELEALQEGSMPQEEYLASLAERFGLSGPREAARVHDAILIEPFEGVEPMVAFLHHAGIHTGCLSITNAAHWASLIDPARFPAIAALELKLASHELSLAKPDPAIFRTYERLSGFAATEHLLLDDSADNVLAARQVGWQAAHIDPAQGPGAQMAALFGALSNVGS